MRKPFFPRRLFPPSTLVRLPARRLAFSLPEALIALLILSVAILAIAAVPVMATKLTVSAMERRQAVSLAVRGLDWLESLGPTESVASADISRGRFRMDYHKPAANEGEYEAAVTVRWNGPAGPSSLVMSRPLSHLADDLRPRAFGGTAP